MIISIIASVGENREIGKKNCLLWDIPEDLKQFRKITMGHPIIMGRKTFESIGKPLTGRTNIIVTRQKHYQPQFDRSNNRFIEPLIVSSLIEGINQAKKIAAHSSRSEVFIIGGGEIYQQAMKHTDKLYLTLVKGTFEADTYFPDYSKFKVNKESCIYQSGEYFFQFLELSR